MPFHLTVLTKLLPAMLWGVRRALKTKHETPKYGLIYHASLIGQSSPKFKGERAGGPASPSP